MVGLYEELYEEEGQKYKWQREDKKRKRSLRLLSNKNNKCGSSSTNSKKTVFIIRLLSNRKEYSFEIPANKYVGHPDEYKEIKQICIKKYGENICILDIATK